MGIKREKMDRENRAKQFMPFDALKGFREALAEKERILVPKRELSEEQKEELDRKLRKVQKLDIVTVEFFQNKEYVQITGMVSRIEEQSKVLEIANTKIAFDDISDLC
ncbi:YolD-like family protein [Konateibacter massiliensis]|uniref:YolD-like family protein n=1 Tax=Konateibacter massiliensis TaxID=2002841 RepID=UPI002E26BA8C